MLAHMGACLQPFLIPVWLFCLHSISSPVPAGLALATLVAQSGTLRIARDHLTTRPLDEAARMMTIKGPSGVLRCAGYFISFIRLLSPVRAPGELT
jgi:hypothetical protein